MRVLYANPIFLNYRIPFYKELKRLFNNEFYILYSKKRYIGRSNFEPLLQLIPKELGRNAISYENEITYYPNTNSFHFIPTDKLNPQLPFVITFPYNLLKTIKQYKPDVLISEGFSQWTPFLCLYAWIHQTPLFIGYERTCHTERNTNYLKKIQRKFINLFVTGYFANGSETKKYLESIGIPSNKIYIGGMSADSQGLKETISKMSSDDIMEFKTKFISHNNGLIYLYSGYFITRKGVDHLLSAWTEHIKKHPNDQLILLGDGILFNKMYSLYKEYKSIHFEGRIPYNEIGKYYAIADVFIMPTIEDNWSLVIPEAMACGLPVTTSIYNGCHTDLIKENVNGITFDTFNHNTIIHALDYFHYVDLKKFGKESIEIEKTFNTENSSLRVYNAIMQYFKK
jgi:glycosyltransferase involved in cell wall biosynthesis